MPTTGAASFAAAGLHRYGQAEEIAGAWVFPTRDAGGYVSGQMPQVNGSHDMN